MALALETLDDVLNVGVRGVTRIFFSVFVWELGGVACEDRVVEGVELGLEGGVALGVVCDFVLARFGFGARSLPMRALRVGAVAGLASSFSALREVRAFGFASGSGSSAPRLLRQTALFTSAAISSRERPVFTERGISSRMSGST